MTQSASYPQERVLPPAAHMRRNLLPRMHAPLRTFMVAVMVMVYLASLAAAAVLLTHRAIDEWMAGVVSEATVQVLPLADETQEQTLARARKVADMLAKRPGVAAVKVLSAHRARAMLEPWLGESGLALKLPVPALVAVKFDRGHPADIEGLRRLLQQRRFQDVELDTHGRWVRELADLARTAWWLGVGVLMLLVVALMVLVTHAAHAALDANRDTIEVLHLIGARDGFIARQVQLHFLRTAFLAAFTGFLGAWVTLALLAFLAPSAGIAAGIRALLFPVGEDVDLASTLLAYAVWLFIIVVTTLISLSSARIATMRILARMFTPV